MWGSRFDMLTKAALFLFVAEIRLHLIVSATRRSTGGLRANPVAAERDQESKDGQTDRSRKWPALLFRMRERGRWDGGGGGGRIPRGGLKRSKTESDRRQQALLQAQDGRGTTAAAASTARTSAGGVSDSVQELTVDFSRDVFAMSFVRYIGVPGTSSSSGFEQWCPSGGAWGGYLHSDAALGDYNQTHDYNYSRSKPPPIQAEQCVKGLDVRGPESREQLEQKREKYAVLFKPFVVKGEDDELDTLGDTSAIFEPSYEQEQNPTERRKEKSGSRPGIVALARDYDAGSHEDVESGLGEVGKGRPIRCLTSVIDIPHGSKAEVVKSYINIIDRHERQLKTIEIAFSWRKEPSDCLRWRWIPCGHEKKLDGEYAKLAIEDHVGRRNVFQLRVFLPSDVAKKHDPYCLTMGLDARWHTDTGLRWPRGDAVGSAQSGLWLWPCHHNHEVDRKLHSESYKSSSFKEKSITKGVFRKQRVGVVKLERRNFPNAFLKKIRGDVAHSRSKKRPSASAAEVPGHSRSKKRPSASAAEVPGAGARSGADHGSGKEEEEEKEKEEGESSGGRVGADTHGAPNSTSSKNDDSQGSSGSPGALSLSLLLCVALFFAAGGFFCVLVDRCCCRGKEGPISSSRGSYDVLLSSSSSAIISSTHVLNGAGSSQAPGGEADASEPPKPELAEQKRKKEKATGAGHVGAPGSKKGKSRSPPNNKRGLDHHVEGDDVIKATSQKKSEEGAFSGDRKTELEISPSGALSFG